MGSVAPHKITESSQESASHSAWHRTGLPSSSPQWPSLGLSGPQSRREVSELLCSLRDSAPRSPQAGCAQPSALSSRWRSLGEGWVKKTKPLLLTVGSAFSFLCAQSWLSAPCPGEAVSGTQRWRRALCRLSSGLRQPTCLHPPFQPHFPVMPRRWHLHFVLKHRQAGFFLPRRLERIRFCAAVVCTWATPCSRSLSPKEACMCDPPLSGHSICALESVLPPPSDLLLWFLLPVLAVLLWEHTPLYVPTLSVSCVLRQVAQSCPPLCDPMDCSPPGSSIHGILQARVLE